MKLIRFSIERPVTITMILSAIVLFGLLSYSRLPQDLFPNITSPKLTIVTKYAKASPKETETLLTKPIEEALKTTQNLKAIYSQSIEGKSVILAQFYWGTDMDLASLEIREKLDLVKTKLPKEAEVPLVKKMNPFDLPLMILSITSDKKSPSEIKHYVETNIKEKIQKVAGVAAVSLSGVEDKVVYVDIDPNKLRHTNVNFSTIIAAIKEGNINYPAGSTREDYYELVVRTLASAKSVEDVAQVKIPLTQGQYLDLTDVATVAEGYEEKESLFRFNGEPALSCTIWSQSQSNNVLTAKKIRKELKQINKMLAQHIHLEVVYDKSQFVQDSINGVVSTAVVGGGLAFAVLMFFIRRVKIAFIVFVAIPISVAATLTLMYLNNQSLNMISLAGMALVLGMLLDNSIVILENIIRYQKKGLSIKEAALKGTKEVAAPLTASTLTSMVVFLPIIFLSGFEAQLFKDLAYTVVFGLVASLFVSLVFIPRWVAHSKQDSLTLSNEASLSVSKFLEKIQSYYKYWFQFCLDNFNRIIRIVGIGFGVSLCLFFLLPKTILPQLDQGEFWLKLHFPSGTYLEVIENKLKPIETFLSSHPKVHRVIAQAGEAEGESAVLSEVKKNQAQLTVFLKKKKRGILKKVQKDLKNKLESLDLSGVVIEFKEPQLFNQNSLMAGSGLHLEILGADWQQMKQTAQQIKTKGEKLSSIKQINILFSELSPEVQIKINKEQAVLYGFSSKEIALALQVALKGVVATRLFPTGDEMDVQVRLDPSFRNQFEQIKEVEILSKSGHKIPLGELAQIKKEQGISQVERLEGRRVLMVECLPKPGKKRKAEKELASLIRELKKTESVRFSGNLQERSRSFKNLIGALLLSILMIYMILAAQFESLWEPFLILFTIPFSVIGVVFGLVITQTPVSVMVFLGMIFLGGIVVNNAIVLVQFIHDLKKEGLPTEIAVFRAGLVRLRPILMNMLTTVFAMIPFVLGKSLSIQIQAPLAITLTFGLIFSTIITLFLIPILYLKFEKRLDSRKNELVSTNN